MTILNTDNLTPARVDKLIDTALNKFNRYERSVDFSKRETTDDLYRAYQRAAELAQQAAGIAGTQIQQQFCKRMP